MQPSNIPKCVLEAKHAGRGAILTKSQKIQIELNKPDSDPTKKKFPFTRLIETNLGNPLALVGANKPFTFLRNVLALCSAPHLMDEQPELVAKLFKPDVIARAKWFMGPDCTNGKGIGAYSPSQGYAGIRRSIARYIAERDRAGARAAGVSEEAVQRIDAVAPQTIVMTNGATTAIEFILQLCLGDTRAKNGIMLSKPTYMLYEALSKLHQAHEIFYDMDEKRGWAFSAVELQKSYDDAIKRGVTPMAIEIINPGNPTGAILERENIRQIIEWCIKVDITIIADEVYCDNIYKEGAVFHSFREVLFSEFPPDVAHKCRLISLSSCSKNALECGLRAAYLQMTNVDQVVQDQLTKLAAINLSPNSCGQVVMEAVVNPPKPGDASYEQDQAEKKQHHNNLKERAKIMYQGLNAIPGVSCQPIDGAMYAFVRLELPDGFKREAQKLRRAADFHFCVTLLEQAGIITVPGAGFHDQKGTVHFRTTILATTKDLQYMIRSIESLMNAITMRYGVAGTPGSKL